MKNDDIDVNKLVDDTIKSLEEPKEEKSSINLDHIDIDKLLAEEAAEKSNETDKNTDEDLVSDDENDELSTEDEIDDEIESDLDDELSEEENELVNNNFRHTKRMLKRLRPLLIIIAILCLVRVGFAIISHHNTELPKSHVYVCDNPNHSSDFDKWIKADLDITWVPTYVVIQDGYVIGAFEGCIPKDTFLDTLAYTTAFNLQYAELPDYEIENLDGERIKVSKLFKGEGPYILELVWIDCEDCAYQDEHYTQDIYNAITTNNVYRYYIKSEKSKVLEKYN